MTSSEGLRNLFDMVGETGQIWLEKTPLFVSHERIARNCQEARIHPGDSHGCRVIKVCCRACRIIFGPRPR